MKTRVLILLAVAFLASGCAMRIGAGIGVQFPLAEQVGVDVQGQKLLVTSRENAWCDIIAPGAVAAVLPPYGSAMADKHVQLNWQTVALVAMCYDGPPQTGANFVGYATHTASLQRSTGFGGAFNQAWTIDGLTDLSGRRVSLGGAGSGQIPQTRNLRLPVQLNGTSGIMYVNLTHRVVRARIMNKLDRFRATPLAVGYVDAARLNPANLFVVFVDEATGESTQPVNLPVGGFGAWNVIQVLTEDQFR